MFRARTKLFADRRDAGMYLASKLDHYAGRADVVVLALPRGGVPVAYEIARKLQAPMDIFIVRKLGVPVHEELAMGAIATGGVRVLNEDVIRRLHITEEMIEAAAEEQERELRRREVEYRGIRAPLQLAGKTVILVDDGLATGASMRAAVQALKLHSPARIVVAVPVGAEETCRLFEGEVDEVICGETPEDFRAVGAWYQDFTQTTDEEVCHLINEIAHYHKVHDLVAKHPEKFSYFV
ncbi:MAG: phosphoribosyltransferase [Limisphaerales bacterium]